MIASRLTNVGVLLLNGTFDEISQSTISTTSNLILADNLDEISISPINNGVAKRENADGTLMVASYFDEFTGAPIVDSSLKVWLDAAQSESYSGSGSNWTNLINSSANATLINTPTFNTLESGGTFTFDKTTFEYATIPDQGDFNVWSVETWAKVTSSLTNQVTSIVTGQFNLSTKLNFSIGTNRAPTSYNLCAGFYDGEWRNTAGFSPTLDTWYHLVGTYDGSTIKFYVNGVLNSFLNYSGTPSSGGEIRIARRWDGVANNSINFFPGDISLVRIYNRSLTNEEVENNFNTERHRFDV
jgi:hypothetical protein